MRSYLISKLLKIKSGILENRLLDHVQTPNQKYQVFSFPFLFSGLPAFLKLKGDNPRVIVQNTIAAHLRVLSSYSFFSSGKNNRQFSFNPFRIKTPKNDEKT